MSALGSGVATGLIVTGANAVADKKISARQVIGVGVYAMGLAAMNEWSPEIASKFALLVLVGVLFAYGPKLINGLGLDH